MRIDTVRLRVCVYVFGIVLLGILPLMRLCVYVYTFAFMCLRLCVYVYVFTFMCLRVCVCVYVFVPLSG